MSYKITNAISSSRVPAWGNQKKYIGVHYLGVVGQAHDLTADAVPIFTSTGMAPSTSDAVWMQCRGR